MIQQVFTNLLSNSIKYAPSGTEIAITARVDGPDLQVKVANEGPPVPDEYLTRIFDKFNRVTEAERITGTGLGLSICKGIIESHGGRIWAANEPKGFAFYFRLPLNLDMAPPHLPAEDVDG
jgi:two-component system sensor histidine kinase KdpD